MKRVAVKRSKDAKIYRHTVKRQNKLNLSRVVMRGGIRM